MLMNFCVSISFTSLNTRMFALPDAYSVNATWTARASLFSSEYIVDSETHQALYIKLLGPTRGRS